MRLDGYRTEGFHDELFLADGSPRPEARALVERSEGLIQRELGRLHNRRLHRFRISGSLDPHP